MSGKTALLKEKERKINQLLKKINPDYEIALLRKAPDGHYRFALSADFDPDDLPKVRKVFRSVLEGFKEDEKKVQTKVYLPESVHERLRRLAFQSRRSLSEVVAEGIEAYARDLQRQSS